MADFDLIPAAYHERRRWRHVLLASALAYVLLALLTGGLLWHLHRDVDALRRAVNRERGRQTVAETLALERQHVLDEQRLVESRLAVLRELQQPVPLRAALALIESALVEGILLEAWTLDSATPRAVISAPPERGPSASVSPTQMRIVGDARTHADLLRYVARLTAANQGGPIEVLRSTIEPTAESVSFELSVNVRAGQDGEG